MHRKKSADLKRLPSWNEEKGENQKAHLPVCRPCTRQRACEPIVERSFSRPHRLRVASEASHDCRAFRGESSRRRRCRRRRLYLATRRLRALVCLLARSLARQLSALANAYSSERRRVREDELRVATAATKRKMSSHSADGNFDWKSQTRRFGKTRLQSATQTFSHVRRLLHNFATTLKQSPRKYARKDLRAIFCLVLPLATSSRPRLHT